MSTTPAGPTPPLCERCWCPILPGQQFAKLGQILQATLLGDIEWTFTYVHRYSRDEGCETAVEPGRVTS